MKWMDGWKKRDSQSDARSLEIRAPKFEGDDESKRNERRMMAVTIDARRTDEEVKLKVFESLNDVKRLENL